MMEHQVPVRASSALALLATAVGACTNAMAPADPTEIVIAAIQVAPRDTVIPKNHGLHPRVSALDESGKPVQVTFQPSFVPNDTSLVTVNSVGLIQSVGPIGSATITVTLGDFSDTVRVNVLDSAVAGRVTLTSRAYAAAISSAGVAYVGQTDLSQLLRADLPSQAFTGAVAVGNIPTEVAFNSTGSRAYVTNQFGQNVGVIDVAANRQITTVPVAGNPFAVIVAPGDSVIYVTTTADSLFGINAATSQITHRLELPIISNGFAIRGSLLYVSTRDAGTVTEIDMHTNAILRTLPVGGGPQGIVVSPDGTVLYVANENQTLEFWSLTSNASLGATTLAGRGFGLALRPTDGYLYVTTLEGGQIQVIDPATQQIVKSIAVGGIPRRIVFDAAGSVGVVANEASWVDFIK